MMLSTRHAHGLALAFWLAGSLAADDFQGSTHQLPFEDQPVRYSQQAPADAIARLQKKIDAGEAKLKFDDQYGYLPALLEALGVPKASQTIVFSKTSLQRSWITPRNPRALYFNDDVYLGFVPGAPVLEISAVDPRWGAMFYTLEQKETERPKIQREGQCLQCHAGSRTLGVPGYMLRSVATDETGEHDTAREVSNITHRTPIADRWAGWYVTGSSGRQPHRGNLIGEEAFERHEKKPSAPGNVTDLGKYFDQRKFPAAGSDIVALMVLEHQAHMHNYITRLGYETRNMMATYGHIRYLNTQINAFLRYLLLTEEAPLTAPLAGNPAFVKDFEARGPRDASGRSLRDLDLRTRIFKHPCSFLIYAAEFDQLPDVMRNTIYERLWAILTGKDVHPDFARIRVEDRRAVLEILRETKAGLPAYWQETKKDGG
jgi:hypothetical protein